MKKIFKQIWNELTMPIPGTNVEIEFGGFIISLFIVLIIIFILNTILS